MSEHLDWHFRTKQRVANRANKKLSQSFFVTLNEWSTSIGLETIARPTFFEEIEAKNQEEQTKQQQAKKIVLSVPADESRPKCAICDEKFEQEWSDEQEAWLFVGVIEVMMPEKSSSKSLVHQTCFEAHNAQASSASSSTASSSSGQTVSMQTD